LFVVEPPQPIAKTLRKIAARNTTGFFIMNTLGSPGRFYIGPRVCCHVRTRSNRTTAHCPLLICQCQRGAGAQRSSPFRGFNTWQTSPAIRPGA
jgi:hypothetical protein